MNIKLWRTGAWVAGMIAGIITDYSDTRHAIITILAVFVTTAACNFCCDKYAGI